VSDVPTLAVVMDYQNIHLTAHDLFAPYGTPVHEVLIHPLLFAEQMLAERATRQRDERMKRAVLTDVYVYRGQPGNKQQPDLHRYTQAQRSEWTRDSRVQVTYRPLRYAPGRPPEEKGIDVLVAINLVRLAQEARHDVVVLAAHDTDQEPALEMAAGFGRARVETCGWEGARRLRIPDRFLWHTALPAARLPTTRDRKRYG
jgi:uncharacterized LabA/DUF88 family protein